MKSTIETSVALAVPARTAYNQWTQFEDFSRFIPIVEEARQVDERHVRWRVKVGSRTHESTTEICEQIPDKRIAWRSVDGPFSAGVVTFHRLTDSSSKLMLQVEYEPEGVAGKVGEALGLGEIRLEDQLMGFKDFIEARGLATGSWRGRIPSPDEEPTSGASG